MNRTTLYMPRSRRPARLGAMPDAAGWIVRTTSIGAVVEEES
jgi:hypothetical protein